MHLRGVCTLHAATSQLAPKTQPVTPSTHNSVPCLGCPACGCCCADWTVLQHKTQHRLPPYCSLPAQRWSVQLHPRHAALQTDRQHGYKHKDSQQCCQVGLPHATWVQYCSALSTISKSHSLTAGVSDTSLAQRSCLQGDCDCKFYVVQDVPEHPVWS